MCAETSNCLPTLKPLLTYLLTLISTVPSKFLRRHPSTNTSPKSSTSSFHSPTTSHFPFSRAPKAIFRAHKPRKTSLLRRYHDPDSDLDVDMEAPPPRISRTWAPQTRSSSALLGFANFSWPFSEEEGLRSNSLHWTTSRSALVDGEGQSEYAVSVWSGEGWTERGGLDDGNMRLVSRVASEGDVGKQHGMGMGIVRTMTTEVTIT
jgi:hypothetical protein